MTGPCKICRTVADLRLMRVEIAVAYANDLAKPFDEFPVTVLVNFKGFCCATCTEIGQRTMDFFRAEVRARGGDS